LLAALHNENVSVAAVRRHLAALAELARDPTTAAALERHGALGAAAAALLRHGAAVGRAVSMLVALVSDAAAIEEESAA
jgi:hypothetical protein